MIGEELDKTPSNQEHIFKRNKIKKSLVFLGCLEEQFK